MKIVIKNWPSFQSYKDRNPPWIRLHKKLLDNYDYQNMSDTARAMLPMLWLMASEYKNPREGLIESDYEKIAFRLRQPVSKVTASIREISRGPFIDIIDDVTDSSQIRNENVTEMLRNCHSETETETETEYRVCSANTHLPEAGEGVVAKKPRVVKHSYTPEFEEFYAPYPKTNCSKLEASKAYNRAIAKGHQHEIIIAGVAEYRKFLDATGTPAAHATTWLNNERWTVDYPAAIAVREFANNPSRTRRESAHDVRGRAWAAALEENSRKPD